MCGWITCSKFKMCKDYLGPLGMFYKPECFKSRQNNRYITATEILKQQRDFEEKTEINIPEIPKRNSIYYHLYCILLSYLISNSKQI